MKLVVFAAFAWTVLWLQFWVVKGPFDFFKPKTFGFFTVGMRLDFTTIMHVSASCLLCFIHPVVSIVVMASLEIFKDGFTSQQGFDILDMSGNIYGWWMWFSSYDGLHLFAGL